MTNTLQVLIKTAHRLPKYKGENPNTYCEITYNNELFTTTVAPKSCNPTWGQLFSFSIPTEQSLLSTLNITVWDDRGKPKNKRKSSNCLGKVIFLPADYSKINFEYTDFKKYNMLEGNSPNSQLEVKLGITSKAARRQSSKKGTVNDKLSAPNGEEEYSPYEQMIKESEQHIDKALGAVKRIEDIANTTANIALETNQMLDEDNESIKKIQGEADNIRDIQRKEGKHLDEMQYGCFGSLVAKMKRKKKSGNKKSDKKVVLANSKREKQQELELKQKSKEQKNRESRYKDVLPTSQLVPCQPDLSHLPEEAQHKNKETDEGLDRVARVLDQIKDTAQNTSNQIDEHNIRLETMQRTVGDIEGTQKRHKARVRTLS